jgi:hypothetical protein
MRSTNHNGMRSQPDCPLMVNLALRMGHEPVGVDILTAIPGVEFDKAWPRRVEDVVDPVSGLKARFISREDPIAAKLAAGRPQDLADVDAIRKAQQSQEPTRARNNPEPSGPKR